MSVHNRVLTEVLAGSQLRDCEFLRGIESSWADEFSDDSCFCHRGVRQCSLLPFCGDVDSVLCVCVLVCLLGRVRVCACLSLDSTV